MQLNLYNTLTRKKEIFRAVGKFVSLYTCGPTVYNYAHIGNLRTFIFEDVLRRTLQAAGYRVRQVMNITDVGHLTDDADQGEDKMQKQAIRERKTAWDIAEQYTKIFHEHARALNILAPWKKIRATDTIAEQIRLIQTLEKKGYTYLTSDGVYFDTSQVKNYGRLARLNVGGQVEGARVHQNVEKRHPTDFALWKFSPKSEKRDMEWPSPWGVGFPGWHIECSAISMSAFKSPTIDIHTGGIDHIPVHHTNEIAQSEAATGKRFVRLWMHGAFLVLEREKMAKSAGNFLTLDSITKKGFEPLDYRFFLLGAHYRQTLTFSEAGVASAHEGRARLQDMIQRLKKYPRKTSKTSAFEKTLAQTRKTFYAALADDLNTPKALAALFDAAKRLNRAMDQNEPIPTRHALELFRECDRILAVDLFVPKHQSVPEDVQELASARETARREKNFARADTLRVKIEARGWMVKDTPSGAELSRKNTVYEKS